MTDTRGVLPKLKDILDAFASRSDVAAGIAIAGWLILWAKGNHLQFAADLPDWFAAIVFVFMMAAAAILFVRTAQSASNTIAGSVASFRRRRAIRRDIETLKHHERSVLTHFVRKKERSFTARLSEETLGTLVARRLVDRAEGTYNRLDWPYIIPEDVWKEINRAAVRKKLGI